MWGRMDSRYWENFRGKGAEWECINVGWGIRGRLLRRSMRIKRVLSALDGLLETRKDYFFLLISYKNCKI